MKKSLVLLFISFLFLSYNNSIAQLPTVTTSTVTDINVNSATSGGAVTYDGGSPIIDKGVCWSTVPNPETGGGNYYISAGPGTGEFVSFIGVLYQPNTVYYVRAYATNNNGTSYGEELSFKTYFRGIDEPFYCGKSLNQTLTGNEILELSVSYQLESIEGLIEIPVGQGYAYICYPDYYPEAYRFMDYFSGFQALMEYQLTYLRDGTTVPAVSQVFSLDLIPVTNDDDETCIYRVYRTYNQIYSDLIFDITEVEDGSIPILTIETSNIFSNSAEIIGNVKSTGVWSVLQRGVCWNLTGSPTIQDNFTSNGQGTGGFIASITDLIPNTTYYCRAYGINEDGAGYTPQISFTTSITGTSVWQYTLFVSLPTVSICPANADKLYPSLLKKRVSI